MYNRQPFHVLVHQRHMQQARIRQRSRLTAVYTFGLMVALLVLLWTVALLEAHHSMHGSADAVVMSGRRALEHARHETEQQVELWQLLGEHHPSQQPSLASREHHLMQPQLQDDVMWSFQQQQQQQQQAHPQQHKGLQHGGQQRLLVKSQMQTVPEARRQGDMEGIDIVQHDHQMPHQHSEAGEDVSRQPQQLLTTAAQLQAEPDAQHQDPAVIGDLAQRHPQMPRHREITGIHPAQHQQHQRREGLLMEREALHDNVMGNTIRISNDAPEHERVNGLDAANGLFPADATQRRTLQMSHASHDQPHRKAGMGQMSASGTASRPVVRIGFTPPPRPSRGMPPDLMTAQQPRQQHQQEQLRLPPTADFARLRGESTAAHLGGFCMLL